MLRDGTGSVLKSKSLSPSTFIMEESKEEGRAAGTSVIAIMISGSLQVQSSIAVIVTPNLKQRTIRRGTAVKAISAQDQDESWRRRQSFNNCEPLPRFCLAKISRHTREGHEKIVVFAILPLPALTRFFFPGRFDSELSKELLSRRS